MDLLGKFGFWLENQWVWNILRMIIIYDGIRVGGWRNGLILWGNLRVGDGVGRKRNSSIVN